MQKHPLIVGASFSPPIDIFGKRAGLHRAKPQVRSCLHPFPRIRSRLGMRTSAAAGSSSSVEERVPSCQIGAWYDS